MKNLQTHLNENKSKDGEDEARNLILHLRKKVFPKLSDIELEKFREYIKSELGF
jgi:hypothetical protein